jgi:hypothetical protein
LCLEVGWSSYITVNHRKAVTWQQFESNAGYNDDSLDAIHYIQSHDLGFYRINKVFSSTLAEHDSFNDAMVQGFYGTPSYSSFNKNEYIDFLTSMDVIDQRDERKTRWSIGLYQQPLLQAVASVKYNLVKSDFLQKTERSNLLRRVYIPDHYCPKSKFD